MYQPKNKEVEFRPNTRKMYEKHHDVKVPAGSDVHHILPPRLGGKHDVENLIVLTWAKHSQAHFDLFDKHGDPKDLCAAYMISGRNEEAHLVACAIGGRKSQKMKRIRGEKNGFQLFNKSKRKRVASKAGSIGGAKQRDLGIGIHVSKDERQEWARLGGVATIEIHGFNDPERQSARGKVGGKGNKGFRWYLANGEFRKYTVKQQLLEPFESFINRTGFTPGRTEKTSK